MVMELIPFAIGIAVAIIVLIAIFSILPDVMGTFDCPVVTGDTDGDFTEDGDGDGIEESGEENWTDDDAIDQWKVSCNDLREQTTVVPVLITLAVVISAILIVTRLFT